MSDQSGLTGTGDILARLWSIVGAANVFSGEAIEERYRTDVLRKHSSRPSYVVRPADTQQVSAVVKIAHDNDLAITALGGRTGVVGGGVSRDGGMILSLERMSRVLEVDCASMTMTVEAGVPLQIAQEAAAAHGFILPLDLGARGSATIGGNIATNAGGVRVLRWGMARDMVLGLEAVLADGTVVSSLSKSLKDNAGYHWKELLVGSEGTLGIITRAVLRLRPQPTSTQTALLALRSFDQVPELLRKLEGRFAGQLSSFELMWNDLYEFSSGARLQARPRPLPAGHSVYVLVETLGSDAVRDLELFQAGLEESQASGLIEDAVIAQSERDRGHFWDIRDDLSELFRPLFPLAAFDISLSLTDMPVFVERTRAGILQAFPQSQLFYYGHAGDGNLHLIVSLDPQDPEAELKVDMTVYSCVRQLGGSISAEHGIGTAKRHFIGFTRTPQELRLMRSIKQALDPKNILNPGKVLPDME